MLTSSISAFSLFVALDKMNFFLSIILMANFSPVVLLTHNFTVAKFPLIESQNSQKANIRSQNVSNRVFALRAICWHGLSVNREKNEGDIVFWEE